MRARRAAWASMMGPDYTHWHGTYEVAKHFYTKMVPDLEHLIAEGRRDAGKLAAAEALAVRLQEVLDSANHRWYQNKMDPEEQQERERRRREVQQRYK